MSALTDRFRDIEDRSVEHSQSFDVHAKELRSQIDDLAEAYEFEAEDVRRLHSYVRGLERAFHENSVLLVQALSAGSLALREAQRAADGPIEEGAKS